MIFGFGYVQFEIFVFRGSWFYELEVENLG